MTNITWSEISTGSLTTDNSGFYQIDIYLTDNDNLPYNNYNSYTINGYLPYCEVFIDSPDLGDESQLMPNTRFTWFNELIFASRQIYYTWYLLGVVEIMRFGVIIGIFVIMGYLYHHQTMNLGRDSKDVIKTIFQYTFFIVTLLYLMLAVSKPVFTIFSMMGILYLGNEILNFYSVDGSDTEKAVVYSTAFFNILLFIWFSLFEYLSNIDFGIPNFPSLVEITLSGLIDYAKNIFIYLISLIFFTIPEVPTILNMILVLLRVIGILSFIIMIKNTVNPATRG